MKKSVRIKVMVTTEEAACFRRKYPKGALQAIARAAWNGQPLPIVAPEERRLHAATDQKLTLIAQVLGDIAEILLDYGAAQFGQFDELHEDDQGRHVLDSAVFEEILFSLKALAVEVGIPSGTSTP